MPGKEDARKPAPRNVAFWTFVALVGGAGLTLLVLSLSGLTGTELAKLGGSFVAVAILLVLSELRPIMTAGATDANGVAISTAFVFALMLHWGLGIALLMQTVGTLLADAVRRKAPWRTAFNVSQYSLSYGAAWGMLLLFGRHPSPLHPMSIDGGLLPAVAVAGLCYFIVNNVLVSQALALYHHTPLRSEMFGNLAYEIGSTGGLLGLAPIIVIVMERGPVLVPLLILPLFAVYATGALSLERERQAMHDSLTGLPNRKLLVRQAGDALDAAASDGTRVALFLLDLDRFKEINDTLGHQVGDTLLQLVGRRIAASVRDTDTVARLGGDEFAVLVPGMEDRRSAVDLAESVRSGLAAPFRVDGMSFDLEGSIGIAVHPDHGTDYETLLQRADVAMYVAKERGTGIELYSPETDKHSTLRLGMLNELRTALDTGELELHYQPKADLRTGDVMGVEALLRWRHSERGLVPPDQFIPLAEQTGLMRHITQFVVDEALRQTAKWWAAGLRVQAAVNVCARDLYDRDFATFLRSRLTQHGVPPRALMVEVTESVLMADPARAATTLLSLADLGVGISLDDFGTGYSSLVHLKRLPVSEVKIDKSFVSRMDLNDDDAAIVRSIIELATALGLRVVAEGVETREAWDQLAVYGCDAAQGWWLAKAMPADDLTRWLEDFRPDRAAAQGAVFPSRQTPEEHQHRSALA